MARLAICFLLLLLVPPAFADDNDRDDQAKWTPVKIPGEQAAPEFADVAEWINSKPLTMAGLKGKVVVVHFMAFG